MLSTFEEEKLQLAETELVVVLKDAQITEEHNKARTMQLEGVEADFHTASSKLASAML